MSEERSLPPHEAFGLLADPIRVEILRVLDDAEAGRALPFSDIYAETDLEDSARFNYHLKKLRPHFVTKTEEGYELTTPGWRAVRMTAAGLYGGGTTVDPFEVEGACRHCGAARLEAAYLDEQVAIECVECGEDVLRVGFPPSAVRDRSPEAMLEAFDRWSRLQVEQANAGVCPSCAGPMSGRVSDDLPPEFGFEVVPKFRCSTCDRSVVTSFGALAYRVPAVRRFHRRRDVDLRDRPYWQIEQFVTDEHTSVRSRDPWRVSVTFAADGDECRTTFDGDLSVVDVAVDS